MLLPVTFRDVVYTNCWRIYSPFDRMPVYERLTLREIEDLFSDDLQLSGHYIARVVSYRKEIVTPFYLVPAYVKGRENV